MSFFQAFRCLFWERRIRIAALSLVVSFFISIFLSGCSRREQILLPEYEVSAATASETVPDETYDGQQNVLTVHVCGAVMTPGVYDLTDGARVMDVVKAAGGFSLDADPDYVNLAKPLEDGEKVSIPTKEEADMLRRGQEDTPLQEENGRININTATKEQLCTLPGVGDTRAEGIIAYREAHGAFEKIEDIMKVSGIKDGLFQKIRDRIKV